LDGKFLFPKAQLLAASSMAAADVLQQQHEAKNSISPWLAGNAPGVLHPSLSAAVAARPDL
jgi:hypothetical protein